MFKLCDPSFSRFVTIHWRYRQTHNDNRTAINTRYIIIPTNNLVKCKVLLYSLTSVGPGADPGVQACHLPSPRTSPSFDQYHIISLSDRGTQVWTTCPRLLRSFVPVWIEPMTYWSQIQRLTCAITWNRSYYHDLYSVSAIPTTAYHKDYTLDGTLYIP